MNFCKNKKSGFTLIELMVVVAVIALLSAIIFASLNKARDKGENTEMIRQVREYANAIQLSYVPNGNAFPTYGGTQVGCLVVTSGSGCRWASGSIKPAYPSAQRTIIDTYISLAPITPPIVGDTGLVYDSVRYGSDATGSFFMLEYPIKNSTDCGFADASQFGAIVGNVMTCRYVSR